MTRPMLIAVVAVLAGCAASETSHQGGGALEAVRGAIVTPWTVLAGGWTAPAAAPRGTVAPAPAGVFTPLLAPTAVALRGNELLVADRGALTLYRVDLARMLLTPWPQVRVTTATRLALARDGSAWVLDPAAATLTRYAADGRRLQTLHDRSVMPAPVDFALSEAVAELVVVDATLGHRVVLRYGTGTAFVPLVPSPFGSRPGGLRAIAANDGQMCFAAVAPAALACVLQWRGTAGEDVRLLDAPPEWVPSRAGLMALDRHGRLFVADDVAGVLRVFADGRLLASVDRAALDVSAISAIDIDIDGDFLAIADAPGARVALFHIRSPRP